MSTSVRSALLSSFAAHFFNIAANVFTVPLFLRAFGVERYGFWGALLGVTSYLSLLNLGIAQTVSSRVSVAPAAVRATVAYSVIGEALRSYFRLLRVALPIAAVVTILVPWARLFHLSAGNSPGATAAAVAVVCSFLLELPASIFRAALIGAGEVATERYTVIASALGRLVVAALCALLHPSLAVSVILLSTVNIAGSLACGLVLRRRLGAAAVVETVTSADERAEFRAASLNYLMMQIAGALVWSTDAILVGVVLGSEEAARVSIAWRLLSVALMFGGLIPPALAPTMAHAWAAGDRARARRLGRDAAQIVFAVSLLGGLALAVIGRQLFTLWVGERLYLGTVAWLAYCVVMLAQAFILVPYFFVQQVGLHERYARWALVEGVLKIALGFLGLRFFGIAGLAIATVLARAATTLWVLPLIYSSSLEVRLFEFVRSVVQPTAIPTLAFVTIAVVGRFGIGRSPPTMIATVVIACIAFVVLFAMRGIDPDLRRRVLGLAMRRVEAAKGAQP
jgi:O-antigen/teichoic acid export membrane protein